MTDVLSRCRRLGFPVLIQTDKKIHELDRVTLLWLFYYLLEIYEPTWSHSPTGFTKSNYKPLSTAMRLLELAHKCPKSTELKKAFEHKKTITSSLGVILDKLEGKYGINKLYQTRFQHPSIKGMQQIKEGKQTQKNKENKNNKNNKNNKENMSDNVNKGIPRATTKNLIECYEESKKEETEENIPKQDGRNNEKKLDKTMENIKHIDHNKNDINHGNDGNDGNEDIEDIVMQETKESITDDLIDENNNINQYKQCNLNAYNFKFPQYKNETIKFHVKMQKNDKHLTMTERYEELQEKQSEKLRNINKMKEEYDSIACDLYKYYSFRAKPFQETSSTDYGLFQLESIKQKLKSKKEIKKEKSVELMETDGIDNLLNILNDQVQNWSNPTNQ